MIPYDDLVAALSAWRARQGLPVSTMSAAASATPAATGPAPGSGPRTAPPMAPPGRSKQPSAPPPLEHADVDDVALLDDSAYENEAGDYAMSFDGGGSDNGGDGATSVGGPPARDTQPSRGRRGNDEW
jgi:hypothetical protein